MTTDVKIKNQLDLEPTWEEIYEHAYTDRLICRLSDEHPDLSDCDLLCMIENHMRRERGLI